LSFVAYMFRRRKTSGSARARDGRALPRDVAGFESRAREALPDGAWAYLSSGTADELSLLWNVQRSAAVRLAPRCLVDVSRLDTRLTLLGLPLAHPILLAPTGSNRRYHRDGEHGVARGAADAQALSVQATFGSTAIEEVAAAATGPLWFQMFVHRDRGFTRELARRAQDAGVSAIVLTVDLPFRAVLARSPSADSQSDWPNLSGLAPARPAQGGDIYHPYLDPGLTWHALAWLCSVVDVPVVVKGVLRPDDAQAAVDHGAGAVIVSNHGARALDGVPATIDALPGVARAVGDQVPVLQDGGIRRGSDVAKALILGADAVLIGRPYIYGLASDGAAGVTRVVEILRTELEQTMGMLGAPTLADLTPDLAWRSG